MKILSTGQYISERMKINPITREELEKAKNESKNTVNPGDDLNDRDFVLIVREQLLTGNFNATYTYYDNYCECLIRADGKGLRYNLLKDTFKYTYKGICTDYIVKIYRQTNGYNGRITIQQDFKDTDKKLENSPDWKCVYQNPVLIRKFNIE